MLRALATDYKINIYFGFGEYADKASESASVKPFGDLALSDKVVAARPTTDKPAKNLLNFAFDGTAELKDANDQVVGKYDIDVDIDLDIFPLIPALLDCVEVTVDEETGTSTPTGFVVDDEKLEGIISAVKEMGYISIEVNELDLETGEPIFNVLTLYSDFSDGRMLAQLNTYGAKLLSTTFVIKLGGIFDFDALAGVIEDVITASADTAAEDTPACEEHTDADSDCICDVCGAQIAHVDENDDNICDVCGGIVDVMRLVGDILAKTNFNAMAEDFDFNKALDTIKTEGFVLYIDDAVNMLLDIVLGSGGGMAGMINFGTLYRDAETLTIKIETPIDEIYGGAVERELKDLYALTEGSGSPNSAYIEQGAKIDKIYTTVDTEEGASEWDGQMTVEELEQLIINYPSVVVNSAGVLISGIDVITGETITQHGKVIGISDYDETLIGKSQEITFYIVDADSESNKTSAILTLVKEMLGLPDWIYGFIPGIQAVTMDVTLTA